MMNNGKKMKVKNPNKNSEIKRLFIILIIISVVGVGAYLGIREYAKSKEDLSGDFQAIADITPPTISATITDSIDADMAKVVRFTIKDQESGSGLYGLCITGESDIDTLLVDEPTCFDDLDLGSNVGVTIDVTMPVEEGLAIDYYAFAKDNFGNISSAYKFVIE